ncbi:MAG: AAA family ATPase [Glaciimonas sp.]|nr:AAA family ATPase [Glaciimonas sp.]
MRLLNITLCNFLCYYDNNKLEFSDGLNLVLGANGYGKSKLYDAIQWLFKDGITDDKPRPGGAPTAVRKTSDMKSEIRHTLANERALAEAEIGSKVLCEVCVEVESGHQDESYRFIRRLSVTKIGANDFKADAESHLEGYRKTVSHFKPVSNPVELLAQLIPSDIQRYVWFQGERGINSLIDTSSRDSLKQVVNQLSDVEKWDRFIEAAQAAYTTADNELKQALKSDTTRKQKTETLQHQQLDVQTKLTVVETKMDEAKQNRDGASEKLDGIISQLTSATKIQALEKERQHRERELGQVRARIDDLKLGFAKRLFTDNWLIMGTEDLVDEFEEKYDAYSSFALAREAKHQATLAQSEQEQTRLPKGIPDGVHVKDMLQKQLCLVCNRPALKGSSEYAAIESLLIQNEPKKTKLVPLPSIELDLREMYRQGIKMREKSTRANDEIAAAYVEQKQLEAQKLLLQEDLERIIGETETETVNSGVVANGTAGSVVLSIESAKRDLERYSGLVERYSQESAVLTESLKAVKEEFGKLTQGSDVDPKLLEKRKMLSDLRELTELTKKAQYKKLISHLEDTANQHYSSINKRTGAVYGQIRFVYEAGGYIPEIQDDAGIPMENLNTSQVSSFKLAIIMAIVTANRNRGVAKNYPLITDAPTSDFDAVKTRGFLAEAAKAFGQSIVIIKDFLDEDPNEEGRYIVDNEKLALIKADVEAQGKKLKIYQLVIPPGQSNQNRKNLSVQITRLAI